MYEKTPEHIDRSRRMILIQFNLLTVRFQWFLMLSNAYYQMP
ncbi:hypothetical protein [Alkalibacterium sp. s-m-22]